MKNKQYQPMEKHYCYNNRNTEQIEESDQERALHEKISKKKHKARIHIK